MTIPFSCPHCGAFSQVADSFAGMTGPCVHCGRSITIPAAAAATGYAPEAYSPPPRRRSSPVFLVCLLGGGCLLLFVCGGGMLALVLPLVQAMREATQKAACASNLRQIAFALESYHTDFGVYPPMLIAGPDGAPMHSWRALILRYLDEDLANQYDFHEPWNSEKNRLLWTQMPAVFACPDNPDSGQQFTSYVAIVGPNYLFSGGQPTSRNSFSDPAATIAVAEVAGHVQIVWLEPRDLTTDSLADSVGDRTQPSISSNHIHGAHVLMANGDVEFLPDDSPSWVTPATTEPTP